MHYVKRVKNTWHVFFTASDTFEFIGKFSNGRDAFSFCSYLNGGSRPSMGPNGFRDLDNIVAPFPAADLENEV